MSNVLNHKYDTNGNEVTATKRRQYEQQALTYLIEAIHKGIVSKYDMIEYVARKMCLMFNTVSMLFFQKALEEYKQKHMITVIQYHTPIVP